MTLNEAYEYVERAIEAEGEQRAEYGSGAVSLGYRADEVMWHYDGYRTSDDADFTEAKRVIAAYQNERQLVKVTLHNTNDLPF